METVPGETLSGKSALPFPLPAAFPAARCGPAPVPAAPGRARLLFGLPPSSFAPGSGPPSVLSVFLRFARSTHDGKVANVRSQFCWPP